MKFNSQGLKADLPVLFLAGFNIVIHLAVINNLEYHRDELLYFSLGEHVDFGFATVPPMIGWIAWLMQNIFGYSLFAVRLFPAILSGFLIIMTSSITKELGGSSYARILSAIGITISGFALRTFSLFMPVFLDVVFWTAIIWLVIRYINTSSGRYLIFLGIVAGLSLLNKYLIGILFVSLAIVISFTQNKKVFRERNFWAGIICASIIFLPNLIWQFKHGLPVINHLSTLNRTQLVHVDPVGFLADQLIMPSFASILTIAGIIYLFQNKEVLKFRFLGVVMILVVVLLFALHGKGYYTIGIFPFLIAAGALSYEKWIINRWIRIAFILFLILITLPMLPIGLPVYKTAKLVSYFRNLEVNHGIVIGRRFEDGSIHSLPQDYADMLGWEELTAITRDAYQQIPDKKACFIYCENYGQAGAITILGKKYNLPAPVSFQESFRYWIPEEFKPDITSFIYINDEMGEDVRNLFGKITLVGRISNHDAREYGTGVFLCVDPKMSFNEFWKKRLDMLQNSDSPQ
jgi:hypothetical protein